MATTSNYTEENIKSLDWREHIRLRPGMYIGKSGDGSSPDDGIYVLLKEVIDNCVDEFVMGEGKVIDIIINDDYVSVRDFGRGIPIGKVVDVVSKMNTGGKYDTRAFKKSVGLNGVGTKAVNALSSSFIVSSTRDGKTKSADFQIGVLKNETLNKSDEKNGDGEDIDKDGYNLKGTFVNGYLENYGILYYPNKAIAYEGEFKKSKFHGLEATCTLGPRTATRLPT